LIDTIENLIKKEMSYRSADELKRMIRELVDRANYPTSSLDVKLYAEKPIRKTSRKPIRKTSRKTSKKKSPKKKKSPAKKKSQTKKKATVKKTSIKKTLKK